MWFRRPELREYDLSASPKDLSLICKYEALHTSGNNPPEARFHTRKHLWNAAFVLFACSLADAAWSWTVSDTCVGETGSEQFQIPEIHQSSINRSVDWYLKTNHWSVCLLQPLGSEVLQLFSVMYDRKWRECVFWMVVWTKESVWRQRMCRFVSLFCFSRLVSV